MKIAVFCSGNGSNFQAIIEAVKTGFIKAEITLMVCDKPKAFAVERAKNAGIRTLIVPFKQFPDRKAFETEIIKNLESEGINLIALAGFMKVLTEGFVKRYKGKILNIHPALLPLFPGTDGIGDTLKSGAKKGGVTVHFVDAGVDTGPIVLQEEVPIKPDDTRNSFAERIHKVEHRIYPRAIKLYVEGKLKIEGKKVNILKGDN